jgi:hypothetical protein
MEEYQVELKTLQVTNRRLITWIDNDRLDTQYYLQARKVGVEIPIDVDYPSIPEAKCT